MKPLVVVTGKNGQLGWELQQLAPGLHEKFEFLFVDADELDLSKPELIPAFFELHQPSFFIHCAAYTAVDKAETDKELAYTINALAVAEIATCCKVINCTLITISTDYVFDGNGTTPYPVDYPINPVNYYGYTKMVSEKLAVEHNPNTIIVRTSWVYSTHGHNFVKTMLRLMKEKPELKVINDQTGCPTFAGDLASALLNMIVQIHNGKRVFGTYHYSNSGIISWYQFAIAIREIAGLNQCTVTPIPTTEYPTPAKRPTYSAMDLSAIEKDYGIIPIPWQDSLKQCVEQLLSS